MFPDATYPFTVDVKARSWKKVMWRATSGSTHLQFVRVEARLVCVALSHIEARLVCVVLSHIEAWLVCATGLYALSPLDFRLLSATGLYAISAFIRDFTVCTEGISRSSHPSQETNIKTKKH